MIYSDKIYDSVWCNFSTEEELQAILDEAKPPKLTNQNFQINTWNYTAKNVPRITADNLGHEWPDSTPFWWNIEQSYKNAAKGFSVCVNPDLMSNFRLCQAGTYGLFPDGGRKPMVVNDKTE